MSQKRRVHVYYTGRVQGVGFRVTAEEVAEALEVVGWVKNLRDGRVELMAEADEATLEEFLRALRHGPMKNFIGEVQATWGQASNAYSEFSIHYQ